MTGRDIVQIRISGAQVGIVGLGAILAAVAANGTVRTDEENREELLRRVGERNYIPRTARESYGRALLRELCKFRGEPVEDETVPGGIRVRILGPGCTRCWQLERDVRDVMAELKIAGELTHVDDVREIARSGVLGAPALVVNDRVLSVGTVPSRSSIRQWLAEIAQEVK